jgi:hypothetical protein
MARIRSVLLILLGIVIGFGSSWSVQATQAQPSKGRLVVSEAGDVRTRGAYFVKDSRSEGCWLVLFFGEQQSLAPAPKEACN